MRKKLIDKALLAQYALIGYNLAEGILSLIFGGMASSIALIGFGFDSFIESLSTIIVTLRLRNGRKLSKKEDEKQEEMANKLIGYTFFIIGLYIVYSAILKLVNQEKSQATIAGVGIALASIIVMPLFAKYRHDLGHKLKSHSLISDAKQTMICTYMSIALIVGIGLNYLFGFWWADPLAALFIAAAALEEGINVVRGKSCCYI